MKTLRELRHDSKIHVYPNQLNDDYKELMTFTDKEISNYGSDIDYHIIWAVSETIKQTELIKFEGWEKELKRLKRWLRELNNISAREDTDDYLKECMERD